MITGNKIINIRECRPDVIQRHLRLIQHHIRSSKQPRLFCSVEKFLEIIFSQTPAPEKACYRKKLRSANIQIKLSRIVAHIACRAVFQRHAAVLPVCSYRHYRSRGSMFFIQNNTVRLYSGFFYHAKKGVSQTVFPDYCIKFYIVSHSFQAHSLVYRISAQIHVNGFRKLRHSIWRTVRTVFYDHIHHRIAYTQNFIHGIILLSFSRRRPLSQPLPSTVCC